MINDTHTRRRRDLPLAFCNRALDVSNSSSMWKHRSSNASLSWWPKIKLRNG